MTNILEMIKNKPQYKKLSDYPMFKLLEVSEYGYILLKNMLNTYLDSYSKAFYIGDVINDAYRDELFLHYMNENSMPVNSNLDFLPAVVELEKLGYIQYDDFFNIDDMSLISLISYQIILKDEFLDILEKGKIEVKKFNDYSPYKEHKSYLSDMSEYILMKYELRNFEFRNSITSPIYKALKKSVKSKTSQIKKRIKETKIELPIEDFLSSKDFNEKQEDIIKMLYFDYLKSDNEGEYSQEDNILKFYYNWDDIKHGFDRDKVFDIKDDIIFYDLGFNQMAFKQSFVYYLEDDIIFKMTSKEELKDNKTERLVEYINKNDSTFFEIVEPKKGLKDIVLSDKIKDNIINVLLRQLDPKVSKLLKDWKIKDNDSINALILFSGKPGTGKTATSMAIGKELKRPIVSFDCSKILDMYVGESEKNVRKIFDTYNTIKKDLEIEPVLLLNEADQFLSKRLANPTGGADNMHNSMQNIFLEQMERFKGILIATTNLVENMDKAFSRRFNYKMEFQLPNQKERESIWKIYTKYLPISKSFNYKEITKYEISGGQIELIVKNTAYKNAINNKKSFTEKDFLAQIEMELGNDFNRDKKMGFL